MRSLLEIDLTMQQMKVLAILVAEPDGSTGQRLAEMLGVSVATVLGILDRLEAHRMVERVQNTNDRRVRRVHATPEGRAAMQRIVTAQPRIEDGPLKQIAIDDLRAFTRGMRAVLAVDGFPESFAERPATEPKPQQSGA